MGEKKDLGKEKFNGAGGRILIDDGREAETRISLRESELLKVFLLPNESLRRKVLEIDLEGDRSQVEVFGVVLGRGNQRLDLTVNTIHRGIGTAAHTHVRGVLFDESSLFFSGLIKIEKKAVKTSSLLTNRVLLLGEGSRADSIPSLEIEADDVKASHAATIGRIDELQLFYLESRGIERRTAVRMIAEGFFGPILEKVSDPKLVARIRGSLWLDILRTGKSS